MKSSISCLMTDQRCTSQIVLTQNEGYNEEYNIKHIIHEQNNTEIFRKNLKMIYEIYSFISYNFYYLWLFHRIQAITSWSILEFIKSLKKFLISFVVKDLLLNAPLL